MAVIGEGNINFDRVFKKARDSGTRYMLVEQDNTSGTYGGSKELMDEHYHLNKA